MLLSEHSALSPYPELLFCGHYPATLRFGNSSTYVSNFIAFVFSLSHYQRVSLFFIDLFIHIIYLYKYEKENVHKSD